MIKANELRIGNYIKTYNSLCWVTTIFEKVPDNWDKIFQNTPPTKEDIQRFHKWRGGCILVESSDDIITPDLYCNDEITKPIELTEEWLLKFGLQKTNSEWWIRVKSPICEAEQFSIYQIGLSEFVFDINKHININLLYVHQFQNLFFALIGEEIEIK